MTSILIHVQGNIINDAAKEVSSQNESKGPDSVFRSEILIKMYYHHCVYGSFSCTSCFHSKPSRHNKLLWMFSFPALTLSFCHW